MVQNSTFRSNTRHDNIINVFQLFLSFVFSFFFHYLYYTNSYYQKFSNVFCIDLYTELNMFMSKEILSQFEYRNSQVWGDIGASIDKTIGRIEHTDWVHGNFFSFYKTIKTKTKEFWNILWEKLIFFSTKFCLIHSDR